MSAVGIERLHPNYKENELKKRRNKMGIVPPPSPFMQQRIKSNKLDVSFIKPSVKTRAEGIRLSQYTHAVVNRAQRIHQLGAPPVYHAKSIIMAVVLDKIEALYLITINNIKKLINVVNIQYKNGVLQININERN